MASSEIDRIVSDPLLFAKVRARAVAEKDVRPLPILRYSSVFAALILVAAGAAFTVQFSRSTVEVASVSEVTAPADVPVEARPTNHPPRKVGSNPSQGRANYYRESTPERITLRTADYTVPKVRKYPEPEEARPEFYPINYTGDAGEITSGSHIVRVDVPRRSLFALGVNVPIENDSETVKADLLVGADGVTRAIRVLK
jgi:hypothetical protein